MVRGPVDPPPWLSAVDRRALRGAADVCRSGQDRRAFERQTGAVALHSGSVAGRELRENADAVDPAQIPHEFSGRGRRHRGDTAFAKQSKRKARVVTVNWAGPMKLLPALSSAGTAASSSLAA